MISFYYLNSKKIKNISMFNVLQNNCFIQHTGNSHSEMHDDSTFIMRGKYKENKPWKDGVIYKGWERPVKKKENGPLLTLYDDSCFTMYNIWEKDVVRVEKFTFELDESDSLLNSSEITMEQLQKSESFLKAQKNKGYYYPADKEYDGVENPNQIEHESGQTTVTITDFICTTCPPDWTPSIEKTEGAPLLEVAENAEVRVTGDISIVANDEGITIKHRKLNADLSDSSDTINFSFEELRKLKQYLTLVPTS